MNTTKVEIAGTPVQQMEVEAHLDLACSVGVMAYNEEKNIGRVLTALLAKQTNGCVIEEIIVLASGCTDRTVEIAQEFSTLNPKVKVVIQLQRQGKASAVNLFMRN